ncbi:MAG: GNAT family N-acetyltransferase [Roseburia sp.]|nr:GNAT family N-acetyltransferase [Roseburia sp.]
MKDLYEIMECWGCSDPELVKQFHPDSPRIVAEFRTKNGHYILKGIPDEAEGKRWGEQTIRGNVLAHCFLGNQLGIAPRIFPLKDQDVYYVKRGGHWFYLLEFIEGRPMQDTPEDEFLLGKLARVLHSQDRYSYPSSLDEKKERFCDWFQEKPFKAAFDALLDGIPDFSKYDRCLIHTDLGPHNAMVRTNGEAVLIDLDDSGIGSRYLDLGWAFIMQFVEHTEDMKLSYRFDLARAFLNGYYGAGHISEREYDLLWQGAVAMHISYMKSYGPDAVDSLWQILQFGLEQKPVLWEMIQKQTYKLEVIQATTDMVADIYEVVHMTIKEIYTKYYSDEVVNFFLELHSKEHILNDISEGKIYVVARKQDIIGTGTLDGNHIKRLFVLPQFQRKGVGTILMDFLEAEIIKDHGDVWIDSSLPAGKFYHNRGYITKEYEEYQLENDKVLAYEIMCRNRFPIDPNEYNAPSQLVRREMELQGIDLDELRKAFPKRLYLLADSLYDTMLTKNAGMLTYHVGGEVYVMNHDHSVGFVKGEMCSPGIATQAEDLIAAGAKELIHVGFAGGYPGTRIGDVVITDGAYNDTAVAGLYGCDEEIVHSTKELTDLLCKEMDAKGITYRRGLHRTTDAGYVQPSWSAKYYENKGVLCVEMEGAGLFSVTKFRSCRAAGIYVISDSGSGDDWNLGWGEKVLEASINRLCTFLLCAEEHQQEEKIREKECKTL